MKSEKIIDALGKIDDRLVISVIPSNYTRKKIKWPVFLATAAALGLCIWGASKLVPQKPPMYEVPPMISGDDYRSLWEEKIMQAPDCGNLTLKEKTMFLDYLWESEILDLPDFHGFRFWFWKEENNIPMMDMVFCDITGVIVQRYNCVQNVVSLSEERQISYEVIREKLYGASGADALNEEIKSCFYEFILFSFDPTFLTFMEWEWHFEYNDSYQNEMLPHLLMTGSVETGIQTNDFVYYENEIVFAGRNVENEHGMKEELNPSFWLYFHDVFLRERYFPGVEEVGSEARNAMMAFFEEDPLRIQEYIGGSWSWSIRNDEGKRLAVLTCEAPLLRGLGNSQQFLYDYESGEVLYGPTGSHGGDRGNDIVEMLRHDLRNILSKKEQFKCIREEFAVYYFNHPEELQYLISENEGQPTYAQQDEVVYYRLQELELIDPENMIYEAKFEGMTIYSKDIDENTENASINGKRVRLDYPWEFLDYEDSVREAIVQTMADAKTYAEQGINVSQQLQVKFKLQDGEKPFLYVGCERKYVCTDAAPLSIRELQEYPQQYHHYSDLQAEDQTTILISSSETISQFQLIELLLEDSVSDQTAKPIQDIVKKGRTLFTLAQVTSDEPIVIDMAFLGGVMNNRGISFTTSNNETHLYEITLSGIDGSIVLRPIK